MRDARQALQLLRQVSSTSKQPSLHLAPAQQSLLVASRRYIQVRSYFTRLAQTHVPPAHTALRSCRPSPIAASCHAFHTSRPFRNDQRRSEASQDGTGGSDQDKANKVVDSKTEPDKPSASASTSADQELSTAGRAYQHFANYPRSLQRLAMKAIPGPQSQQPRISTNDDSHEHHRARPSKEELLHLAQGFWTRLRIRFKWFTIRGFRRFNADDISAFFTLGGFTTAIFIIAGTTTFVSLVFAALNALSLQEWIARVLADYLTAETGVTVVFESAILPNWKESKISFKNVFISRRVHGDVDSLLQERRQKTRSGTPDLPNKVRRRTAITAGEGMAWEGTHHDEVEEVAPPMSDEARGEDLIEDDTVNTNYTMFDLQVDSIDVTLSLHRWFDGKGLIEDAVVRGVRGIIDRRNVFWDPSKPYDPKAARREPSQGDFELESMQVEDFLVTVYQPNGFRPFNFSVFNANISKLRKQWLFYDLLSADHITGQVDGCLFSLHKPQSISRTVEKDRERVHSKWKTMSRMRVDGVNFDHIQSQSDLTGPISWILSGKFDVVADIKFPRDLDEEADINTIIAEVLDNLSAALSGEPHRDSEDRGPIPGQHRLSGPAIQAPVSAVGPTAERVRKESEEARRVGRELLKVRAELEEMETEPDVEKLEDIKSSIPRPAVVMDMDVRFKDVKAAVPLFTKDISYSTNAIVRPIVAFMNANKTLIPIHCRIVMDLSEFDGSMDLAQTGMLPVVSDKIYEALANHVASQNASHKRLKNVSLWSLQLSAHAALNLMTLLRDSLSRNTTPTSTASAHHHVHSSAESNRHDADPAGAATVAGAASL